MNACVKRMMGERSPALGNKIAKELRTRTAALEGGQS
jgi:hypothetical protein